MAAARVSTFENITDSTIYIVAAILGARGIVIVTQ